MAAARIEEAGLVADALGDHLGLGPLGRRPGLHEADHIGGSRRQNLLDAGLALLPGPVAPPDVPGDDSHRGLDDGAVGLVLVEAHRDSLAPWRLVRPELATGSPTAEPVAAGPITRPECQTSQSAASSRTAPGG